MPILATCWSYSCDRLPLKSLGNLIHKSFCAIFVALLFLIRQCVEGDYFFVSPRHEWTAHRLLSLVFRLLKTKSQKVQTYYRRTKCYIESAPAVRYLTISFFVFFCCCTVLLLYSGPLSTISLCLQLIIGKLDRPLISSKDQYLTCLLNSIPRSHIHKHAHAIHGVFPTPSQLCLNLCSLINGLAPSTDTLRSLAL